MDVKKKFIAGSFCFVIFTCLIMTTAWAAKEKEKGKKTKGKKEEKAIDKTKEDKIRQEEAIKKVTSLPSLPPSFTTGASSKGGFKLPSLPPNVPPVSKYPDPSIVEVQKQLADIVKIQQTLQLQQTQQISEIQKIVEQAEVHQKLLGELEKARGNVSGESQIDEAIRRQKIQLIEEQAAKNQAALEEMKEKKDAKEKSTEKKLTAISDKAPSEQKPKKSGWWWNFEK